MTDNNDDNMPTNNETIPSNSTTIVPSNSTSAVDAKKLYESRRRYRNFRFSIPLSDFQARKDHLMSIWEKHTLFLMGQQELSYNGHNHIEIFCTMNNCKFFIV